MNSSGPPARSVAKNRKNVVLSQLAIWKGKKLAAAEKRDSFSNLLEVLLDREYTRVFGTNGNGKDKVAAET